MMAVPIRVLIIVRIVMAPPMMLMWFVLFSILVFSVFMSFLMSGLTLRSTVFVMRSVSVLLSSMIILVMAVIFAFISFSVVDILLYMSLLPWFIELSTAMMEFPSTENSQFHLWFIG